MLREKGLGRGSAGTAGNEERLEIEIPRKNRGGANQANGSRERDANDDRCEGNVRDLADTAMGG